MAPDIDSVANKGLKAAEFAAFVADAGTEQIVRTLIQEQVMTFTVVRRGGIKDAIHYLETSLAPAILLVDISGIALPLSEVDRLMNACDPSVIVLVTGEPNDIGLYRSMMQLGVNDYLVKPLTVELLRRTVASCNRNPDANKSKIRTGKITAVTATRGGAGASTVMANLGWTLANCIGRKVVLMDVDVQFSALSLMMGLKKSNSLTQALNNAHRLDGLFLERMLMQHGDKLFILSAEESITDDIPVDYARLETLIRNLEQQFHYIMIDLPRRPGELYRRILELVQVNFIVATPTVSSVRDVIRILHAIGREEIGRRAVIILNHVTPASLADVSVKEFEAAIGRKIDYVIPFSSAAMLADNKGTMLSTESPAIGKHFLRIANDLSGRGSEAASRPGLFGRLFGKS